LFLVIKTYFIVGRKNKETKTEDAAPETSQKLTPENVAVNMEAEPSSGQAGDIDGASTELLADGRKEVCNIIHVYWIMKWFTNVYL